jgi:hypothetical protein
LNLSTKGVIDDAAPTSTFDEPVEVGLHVVIENDVDLYGHND